LGNLLEGILQRWCTEAPQILLAARQKIKLNLKRNLSIVKPHVTPYTAFWLDQFESVLPQLPTALKAGPPA